MGPRGEAQGLAGCQQVHRRARPKAAEKRRTGRPGANETKERRPESEA